MRTFSLNKLKYHTPLKYYRLSHLKQLLLNTILFGSHIYVRIPPIRILDLFDSTAQPHGHLLTNSSNRSSKRHAFSRARDQHSASICAGLPHRAEFQRSGFTPGRWPVANGRRPTFEDARHEFCFVEYFIKSRFSVSARVSVPLSK